MNGDLRETRFPRPRLVSLGERNCGRRACGYASPLNNSPRFNRRIGIRPGVRLNLSKSGVAFAERVKMHSLFMEGLDLVFKARGLQPYPSLQVRHDAIVQGSCYD
jgi:hypothetical protein